MGSHFCSKITFSQGKNSKKRKISELCNLFVYDMNIKFVTGANILRETEAHVQGRSLSIPMNLVIHYYIANNKALYCNF